MSNTTSTTRRGRRSLSGEPGESSILAVRVTAQQAQAWRAMDDGPRALRAWLQRRLKRQQPVAKRAPVERNQLPLQFPET